MGWNWNIKGGTINELMEEETEKVFMEETGNDVPVPSYSIKMNALHIFFPVYSQSLSQSIVISKLNKFLFSFF